MKKVVEADDMVLHHLRDTFTMLLLMTGQLEEAEKVIKETTEIMRQRIPPQHPAFVMV